jgi:hypothetical protein
MIHSDDEIRIDKDIRSEVFRDFIKLDSEDVSWNGNTYKARFNQPSERRKMQVAGYSNEVLDFECMIYISDNGGTPVSGQTITRLSDGKKFKIIPDVKYDLGNACYTLMLTNKK